MFPRALMLLPSRLWLRAMPEGRMAFD